MKNITKIIRILALISLSLTYSSHNNPSLYIDASFNSHSAYLINI